MSLRARNPFVVAVALAVVPAQAWAADTVAVLPLEITGGIVASRQALEAAAAAGVAGPGRAVVGPGDVAARLTERPALAACRTPSCWREVGAALGASHLLQGTVRREAGELRVRFELVDAEARVAVASHADACAEDDCSVGDLTRRTAQKVTRDGLEVRPAAPLAVLPPPAVVEVQGAPLSATSGWLPATLVGAGAVVAGAGVALLVVDGNCTAEAETRGMDRTVCLERFESTAAGWVGVGAGLALAGAGVYLHLRRGSPASPSAGLVVGPSLAAVVGRF